MLKKKKYSKSTLKKTNKNKISNKKENTRNKKLCFLSSPIGHKGSQINRRANIVRNSIRRELNPLGYKTYRADDITTSGKITDQIIEYLDKSDLVIVDVSGNNPNVFYELAVRNALHKPVILIAKRGQVLPFNIKDYRTIYYDVKDEIDKKAISALKKFVREIEKHPLKSSQSILSSLNFAMGTSEIRNLFRMPIDNTKRDERMRELYSEEWDKFSLLALEGSSFLRKDGFNWRNGIKKHLDAGRKMRILLIHPNGLEEEIRKKAQDRDPNTKRNVDDTLLRKLATKYSKNLEIRFTRFPVYCSLFIWKKGFFYDPYHLGSLKNNSRGQNAFIVAEFYSDNHYYKLMNKHFEFLWENTNEKVLP